MEIKIADARSLTTDSVPLKDEVQIITAISTLEHLEGQGDIKAIREIEKLLKPGGYALLLYPTTSQLPFFLKNLPKKDISRDVIIKTHLG